MSESFTEEPDLEEPECNCGRSSVITEMAELLRAVNNYGTRLEYGEEWSQRVDAVLAQVSTEDADPDD
jgi:hypothetical protein